MIIRLMNARGNMSLGQVDWPVIPRLGEMVQFRGRRSDSLGKENLVAGGSVIEVTYAPYVTRDDAAGPLYMIPGKVDITIRIREYSDYPPGWNTEPKDGDDDDDETSNG